MMREAEFGAHSQPSRVREQCRPDEHEERRRMRGQGRDRAGRHSGEHERYHDGGGCSVVGQREQTGEPPGETGNGGGKGQEYWQAMGRTIDIAANAQPQAEPRELRQQHQHEPAQRPGNWNCADQQNRGQHGKHAVDRGEQRLPVQQVPQQQLHRLIQRACRSRASVPSGALVHDRVALFPCRSHPSQYQAQAIARPKIVDNDLTGLERYPRLGTDAVGRAPATERRGSPRPSSAPAAGSRPGHQGTQKAHPRVLGYRVRPPAAYVLRGNWASTAGRSCKPSAWWSAGGLA